MQKLTDIDTQIIEALRKDARQPNKAMASKIGVSEETVRRHVHQMVKSGALQFHVNVSAEALGMPVSALINVQVTPGYDNLLERFVSKDRIRVIRVYEIVDGNQVYVITAATLQVAAEAVMHIREAEEVENVTITFLYPNREHRI